MKILVTGAQGFVGAHLVRVLKDRNHSVFELDVQHGIAEHAFTMGYAPSGTYFRCDISQYRQIERIIEYLKPDLVFNAAAEFGRHNGTDFYEILWSTNVVGFRNLLMLQNQFGFHMTHFSSSEVYGDHKDTMFEIPIQEYNSFPLNDYALTKWVNEAQINTSDSKEKCCILRLFNLYGPYEHYSVYRSLVCRLVYSCLHNKPFKVFVGHKRSHLFIDDAVNAIANLTALVDTPYFSKIFNIGSKENYSIEDIAQIVVKKTGRSDRFITLCESEEPLTAHWKNADLTNSQQWLQLLCTVDLQEGVKRTSEWMLSEYRSNTP